MEKAGETRKITDRNWRRYVKYFRGLAPHPDLIEKVLSNRLDIPQF